MSEWQRWKNIMKCYPFEEKRLAKWKPPYIVQPKYDGIRCRAISMQIQTSNLHRVAPGQTDHLLLSSEENPIFSVPHINIELSRLRLTCELDGELYCHGMPFEQITSITSRTVNIHPDSSKIQYWVFDIVNDLPQMKRTLIIENLRGLSPLIQVAPFYLCENLDDVMRAYDKLIEDGYEGIIVRHIDSLYERKRSTFVMKFKPKQQDEYEITGFQEEVDKGGTPLDTLGALTCKSGDGNTFNCGTGFSDERRKQLWDGRDLLVGAVAVIKYQHLSVGRAVPRFPVFVEIKVRT
jgi:ATP-dependent DNA ligase